MEVDIYQREKMQVGNVPVSECFKSAAADECFQRIDLSGEEAFKSVLREDIVYASNLSTGMVFIFEASMVVYRINLEVVEMEKKDKPDV